MENIFKPKLGTGDDGDTDLLNGKRVHKTDLKIKLNASLDELSSTLGLLKVKIKEKAMQNEISDLQKTLIKICGINAGSNCHLEEETKAINKAIAFASSKIIPPKEFIIPGANISETLTHLARTKTRICEINAWEIKQKEIAVFLNRLSDYLFLFSLLLKDKNKHQKLTSGKKPKVSPESFI